MATIEIEKEASLADRLKKLRMQKGFSQRAFAASIGLNYVQYNRYEKEERKPSTNSLTKIADGLNVSVDYLLEGKEEDAATANMADQDLLEMFEQTEKLDDKNKEHVKALLGAFLKDKQLEKIYSKKRVAS